MIVIYEAAALPGCSLRLADIMKKSGRAQQGRRIRRERVYGVQCMQPKIIAVVRVVLVEADHAGGLGTGKRTDLICGFIFPECERLPQTVFKIITCEHIDSFIRFCRSGNPAPAFFRFCRSGNPAPAFFLYYISLHILYPDKKFFKKLALGY